MSRSTLYREKTGPGPWLRATGTAAAVTLPGLDPSTTYEFDVGDGTIREATTTAAGAVPDIYSGDSWALLNDGTVRIYTVVSSSDAITKHQYRIDDGGGFGSPVDIIGTASDDYTTTAEIGDIVQIRAVSANGEGGWSQSRTVGDQIAYVPMAADTGIWTSRWNGTKSLLLEDGLAQIQNETATLLRAFYSLDSVNGQDLSSVQNISAYFEVDSNDSDHNADNLMAPSAMLALRASGGAGSETAYRFGIGPSATAAVTQVRRYINGTTTSLSADSVVISSIPPRAQDAPCAVEVKLNGSAISVKSWLLGTAEPSSPQSSMTDSAITAGGRLGIHTGIATQKGAKFRYFGFGLNNATAPRPLT